MGARIDDYQLPQGDTNEHPSFQTQRPRGGSGNERAHYDRRRISICSTGTRSASMAHLSVGHVGSETFRR